MALLPPGSSGSGEGGTTVHNDLVGRDQPNSHPISAVTGLSDWLNGHDTQLLASRPLRFIFMFANTTTQVVNLPTPLDTPSLAIVITRTSDGAMIEPEVTYLFDPGPQRFISGIRLGFTPAVSGEFIVHIIR